MNARLLLLGSALSVAVACEHAPPFGAADLGPNAPFSDAFPRRLTFAAGGDLAPAWLPDGSGIIYSFQRDDRADHDRCLGILPAEGGQRVRTICHAGLRDPDSTNTLWSPAVGPGGVLAYVRESSVPGWPAPSSRELVVASLDDPDPGRVVRSFPYTAPDGRIHATATHLNWVDAHTLVYVAQTVTYRFPPPVRDTALTPVEAVRLDLIGDAVAVSVLPGTDSATSVAADSAGAIYYTVAGAAAVWRIPPGGGAATLLFDFTPLGPASDVQIRGGTLVVVAGGVLYRADLFAHTLVQIPAPDSLSPLRPALSPSGARLAIEAWRPGGASDLWLLRVP